MSLGTTAAVKGKPSLLAWTWPVSRNMAISGMGGLGVLVREGEVRPVSLVRSAVEATLMLLAMERLRSLARMERGVSCGSWAS